MRLSRSFVMYGSWFVNWSGLVVNWGCMVHGSWFMNWCGFVMDRGGFVMDRGCLVHWCSVVDGGWLVYRSSVVRGCRVMHWSGVMRSLMMDWSSVRCFVVHRSSVVDGSGCVVSRCLVVLHWSFLSKYDVVMSSWLSVVGSGNGSSLVMGGSSCSVVRSLVMSLGAVVVNGVGDVVGLVWVLGLLGLVLELLVVWVLHFAHLGVLLLDVMSDVWLLHFVRLGSLLVVLGKGDLVRVGGWRGVMHLGVHKLLMVNWSGVVHGGVN